MKRQSPRLIAVRALALLAALTLASPTVFAEPSKRIDPEAQKYLERGIGMYQDKRYADAVSEFEAGYAIDPHPNFLFAWAQAARLSGDCGSAIDLYDKFIATAPPAQQIQAAQTQSRACREELSAASTETEEPDYGPEPEPEPEPEPAPEPEPEDKWYKDVAGGVLLGLGVAGAAAGAGVLGASNAEEGKAMDAATYQAFDDSKGKARTLRIAGAVTLSLGGALLLGGIVRYIVVASKINNGGRARASLWLDGESAGVAVAGKF